MATLHITTAAPTQATGADGASHISDNPSDAVALVGYLGERSPDGYHRLYENQTRRRYLVVRDDDIVGRSPQGANGYTRILVRHSATLVLSEQACASSYSAPLDSTTRHGWPRG